MVQRPRGTRDFGPDEMAVRHHVAEGLRRVFASFGYREVQTPTFEPLELFTAKSGEGIVDELYRFEDKAGRRLALRPELTAPVMRFYFAEHAFDPKPLKWFYFSNCFRYDRPQAGRYREFWQFGCEQVGAGTPLAYAELIALADACLRGAGLTGSRLTIGHVGVLRAAVDTLGLEEGARGKAMRLLDKKDMDGLAALCGDAGAPDEALDALRGLLEADDPAQTGFQHDGLTEVADCMRHLRALGVDARLELGIARGLDYYTGIVFEAHADGLGAQSQVLGGGGYDLSQVFDGQPTPTMGFGLGFDRLIEALEGQGVGLPAAEGPHVCFGWLSPVALETVLDWVRELRGRGVAAEVDLMGRKPGQVAGWADAVGAKHLVIVGDRDLEAGKVQVKELASGATTQVPIGDVVGTLSGST